MREKDAKSCLPEPLKNSLHSAWNELRKNRTKYSIFWDFIDKERHNILKEYEFSAYEAILTEDGTVKKTFRSLLSIMEEGEKETLLIKSGPYEGRLALEVLTEAVQWIEDYIFDAIRKTGYDPHESRRTTALLPPLQSKGLSLLEEIWQHPA